MQIILSNPLLAGLIALGLLVLILSFFVIRMHIKMRRFLIEVDAQNIADSLQSVAMNLSDLQKFRGEIEAYLESVEDRLKKSVQSIHTVRFNPFKGTGAGGNQSFATAFLTEEGDGVILSSLYSRDHVSVFAKPVKGHVSLHEMSEEERESLENAKQQLRR